MIQVSTCERFSVNLCRNHPDKIFVFGDNLDRSGRGGQAIIRYEPNAFGVPTKRFPRMHESAFFSDQDCERKHVTDSLRRLWQLGQSKHIVFPTDGLGTGLAKMREKSPLIYTEMCEILLNHFGYKNGTE